MLEVWMMSELFDVQTQALGRHLLFSDDRNLWYAGVQSVFTRYQVAML